MKDDTNRIVNEVDKKIYYKVKPLMYRLGLSYPVGYKPKIPKELEITDKNPNYNKQKIKKQIQELENIYNSNPCDWQIKSTLLNLKDMISVINKYDLDKQ